VGKAVVVLAPDVGGEKVVQRGNRRPPGNGTRELQPFGVLVEHRVHDVDERLVAIEQTMAARQQVSLQPALALVLTEHLHHSPLPGQVFITGQHFALPLALRHFEQGLQAVGDRLVGSEMPEVRLLRIASQHLAQKAGEHTGVPDARHSGRGHIHVVVPARRHD